MSLSTLAYFSDVFSNINELNLSLQGNSWIVRTAHEIVKGFERKLGLWISCVKQEFFTTSNLEPFLVEHDLVIENELYSDILKL